VFGQGACYVMNVTECFDRAHDYNYNGDVNSTTVVNDVVVNNTVDTWMCLLQPDDLGVLCCVVFCCVVMLFLHCALHLIH